LVNLSKRNLIVTITIIVLTAMPLGAAGWGVKGIAEPQSHFDSVSGWMFLAPDTDPNQAVAKVYFAGFATQCAETCPGLSPNLATLGSRVQTADVNFRAVLGVWKDCNNDGYVGLGDEGLLEYRATILDATFGDKICPAQPLPKTIPPGWMPVHNDGQWVHELIPINWLDKLSVTGDHNPFNIDDNNARVWADYGLPGDAYSPSCPLIPVEHGTYESTGGMLHEYDCREGYQVTDTIDKEATGPLAPLSFGDAPRDQGASHSLLNQQNPWGQQGDASDAQAWDCSKPQLASETAGNPDGQGWTWVNVSQPKMPPSVSTGGSVAGTLNATGSGFDQCNRNTFNNGDSPQGLIYRSSDDHVHEGGALANAPYVEEYNVASTPTKVQADDNLVPTEVSRPAAPTATLTGPSGPSAGDGFGVEEVEQDGIWAATTQWTNPFVLQKYSLQTAPVPHTYYAYVSPTAITAFGLQLPKGSLTGTYGAEACGTIVGYNPATNWQCDPTQWYINSLGQNIDPTNTRLGKDPNAPPGTDCVVNGDTHGCIHYGARVGWAYNLLDVQCNDQSIDALRGAGVGYGAEAGGDVCRTE
jgi:hypothetical protein